MISYSACAASLAALCASVSLAACGGADRDGNGPVPRPVGSDSAASTSDSRTDLAVAARQLTEFDQRRSLIKAANDIKRLQRTYGYYLDHGLWDQAADLFAANATIEIGLDGVYVGRDRIRDYLYALGDGEEGLAAGQLNEHMQLMPVITVAPDGQTARGRWRDLMLLGEYGVSAFWGEGPQENEYIREDGVWKFSKLHWYQSIVVPYAGGWQVNPDINGGHWVDPAMTPDRPPSVDYETWPGTYLPPFHFDNPVLGATPSGVATATSVPQRDSTFDALAGQAAILLHEVQLLEDENAIENLQRIYGFYIDKGFWTEAARLFADDGTIEIGGSGTYVGSERIREFLESWGAEFPQDGRLFDRMQLQPVVHVAPDGQTAKARWRLFAQEARAGEFAHWGVGVYENTYVKTDGGWRIQSLHGYPKMYTTYEQGWGEFAIPDAGPSPTLPPDRPPPGPYARFPASADLVIHYENPVTGAPVYAGVAADHAAEPPQDLPGLTAAIDELAARLVRLEDFDALERLNAIYGYYLARNEWDNLTGIFAVDGTIEIAMRGVYAGSASIRRNLNLYGEAGTQQGLLHNHMQYQPVIDIAADGLSALMRSRAFSIMGQYEAYSMWMGGTYENLYIKEGSVWKIKKDQIFNTYFAPYAVGWKNLAPRPPPGISDSNPPDSPPTHPFEMYPSAFLPPFHYPNPATGEAVIWERGR